ncbi:MAG TPA: UDP-N-acetylglucosamine--N-acetylmuramyl-(pentapeptide) pyrophosphoryl-undecaprenol N-acetylglucosamine transferase [Candidatus Paceibacterota bacterium]|nr:UDP-N-acetylglucosamine--N-acetylmuramyl-(pentapeptide) pyrophosphoryl-undecaprenol N-acetylglucosamine transferase [Candidatus Paceibacterota bacterium]
MKEIRIAFTGGGTGGHVYPLLTVADSIKKQLDASKKDYLFYYFGSPDSFGTEFLSRKIKIVNIVSFKFRRYFSVENIIDFFKFPIAFIQAFVKMFFVMPDIVFSKGGTGAIAVVLAAAFYRIPIFIHESDSIPGLSSKISFPFAKRVAVSFSKTLEYFSGSKVALVGNPIRSFLLEPENDLTQEKAKKIFGFDPGLPLILVLGGSQGSTRINEFMLDNVKDFISKYQVLHQVGLDNFSSFKNELAVATQRFIPQERTKYRIVDFFRKEMKDAMIAADVIVSRSGSGAIFEIASFKKPSILIPLPESANNHQFYNAYEFAKKGSCIVIEEDNLQPTIFFNQLDNLIKDPQKYSAMAGNAGLFSKPQAADMIAGEIISLIK